MNVGSNSAYQMLDFDARRRGCEEIDLIVVQLDTVCN